MSTCAASAASNDAVVLPGAMWSAPLWPTRRSVTSDMPGTSRSCGCRRPGRAPGSASRGRSAGTGGPPCRRRGGSGAGCRRAAERCMRGRHACTIASASASETSPIGRHGSMPRLEAALDLPQVADAGDRALVEHGVADRPRRVVLAQAAQEALGVELGREDVGAEPAEALVEARARLGHQLEHRPVELHDRAPSPPQHEPGGAGRAPRAVEHAPRAGHPQVRVDREVALEAQEQVLAVRVDRA